MTADDPLLDLAAIAEYTGDSIDYVRRRTKLPEAHPEYLPAIKHAGRIKARRSAVNAWIDRNSEAAS